MTKGKAKKFWRTLFGVEIGAKVRIADWKKPEVPHLWIWMRDCSSPGNPEIKIPVEKFVGEIVKRSSWDQNAYHVRWIADRRPLLVDRGFVWKRGVFDIIEE